MIARLSATFDPLVRLLIAAILLASLLPVAGPAREVAQTISNAAIFALFFLNGVRLPRAEVISGIGNWRFLLPLTVWCFAVMGAAGWGLSLLADNMLPPIIALGLLFLGILPSTVQSAAAYSSLAGGNVAVSVVAAAVINIMGVFITAPLLGLVAGSAVGIDLDGLQRIALILLLPFALGQILQRWLGELVKNHRQWATWMDRISIAIAVYVAFSGAVGQGLWGRVDAPAWAALLALVTVFLAFGFGGAWLTGGALGFSRPDRISFLFAGAQKSIALGAPLAAVLFPPATAGLLLLPVLVYHLLQLIISAPLAARLNRPDPAH